MSDPDPAKMIGEFIPERLEAFTKSAGLDSPADAIPGKGRLERASVHLHIVDLDEHWTVDFDDTDQPVRRTRLEKPASAVSVSSDTASALWNQEMTLADALRARKIDVRGRARLARFLYDFFPENQSE